MGETIRRAQLIAAAPLLVQEHAERKELLWRRWESSILIVSGRLELATRPAAAALERELRPLQAAAAARAHTLHTAAHARLACVSGEWRGRAALEAAEAGGRAAAEADRDRLPRRAQIAAALDMRCGEARQRVAAGQAAGWAGLQALHAHALRVHRAAVAVVWGCERAFVEACHLPGRELIVAEHARHSAFITTVEVAELLRVLTVAAGRRLLRLYAVGCRGLLRRHEAVLMRAAEADSWPAELLRFLAQPPALRRALEREEAARWDRLGMIFREGARKAEARRRAREDFEAWCAQEALRLQRAAERSAAVRDAELARERAMQRADEAAAAARRERARAFLEDLQRRERARQLHCVQWRSRDGRRRAPSPPPRCGELPLGPPAALADPVLDTMHRVAAACLLRGADRAGDGTGGDWLDRLHRAAAGATRPPAARRSRSAPGPPEAALAVDERQQLAEAEGRARRGLADAAAGAWGMVLRLAEDALREAAERSVALACTPLLAAEARGRAECEHEEWSLRAVLAERADGADRARRRAAECAEAARGRPQPAAGVWGSETRAAELARRVARAPLHQTFDLLLAAPGKAGLAGLVADRAAVCTSAPSGEARRVAEALRVLERRREAALTRRELLARAREQELLRGEEEKVWAARDRRRTETDDQGGFASLWQDFDKLAAQQRAERRAAEHREQLAALEQAEGDARGAVSAREGRLRDRAADLFMLEGVFSMPGEARLRRHHEARCRRAMQTQELDMLLQRLRHPQPRRAPPGAVRPPAPRGDALYVADRRQQLIRSGACDVKSLSLLGDEERVLRVGAEEGERRARTAIAEAALAAAAQLRAAAVRRADLVSRRLFAVWREEEGKRQAAAAALAQRYEAALQATARRRAERAAAVVQRSYRCHAARQRLRAERQTGGGVTALLRLEGCLRRHTVHVEDQERDGLRDLAAGLCRGKRGRRRAELPGAPERAEAHVRQSLRTEEEVARRWARGEALRGAERIRRRAAAAVRRAASAAAGATAMQRVVRGWLARRAVPRLRELMREWGLHRRMHLAERAGLCRLEEYGRQQLAEGLAAGVARDAADSAEQHRRKQTTDAACAVLQRAWRGRFARVKARQQRARVEGNELEDTYCAQLDALSRSRAARPLSAAIARGPPPAFAAPVRPASAGATRGGHRGGGGGLDASRASQGISAELESCRRSEEEELELDD
eukprot:TRINITY_DN3440_c0_g2_i1.p1 TRINITY_DN3440_c0_g2~~TRINITY_DN3440_c0_g2_i1.p1  ORF type:complete len:1372 (+),score=425.32 TRINITY_DN3440_c0_g2_i1:500-4117(+)